MVASSTPERVSTLAALGRTNALAHVKAFCVFLGDYVNPALESFVS